MVSYLDSWYNIIMNSEVENLKKDAVMLARQVVGTMTSEGMSLKQSEYNRLVRFAIGQQ